MAEKNSCNRVRFSVKISSKSSFFALESGVQVCKSTVHRVERMISIISSLPKTASVSHKYLHLYICRY